jgi:hypothetical protein
MTQNNNTALATMTREEERKQRGGRREGAGRKRKPPTITVSFRIRPEYADGVINSVKTFLASKKT